MLMNISLKKRTLLVLLSGLTATFTLAQQQPLPEWQSQYAVGLNKLAPHTYVWPYANASDIEKPGGYEQSPFYMSLNGKWKFHWVKNPDNRPKDFYQPSYYTGGWADINVPGNWERQGYGTAIYVNETYEFDDKMFNFKKNPPLVPYAENAAFRSRFTAIKKENKIALAQYIKETKGIDINPDSIFDIQVKRLHEYKRQLLNILHVIGLYNHLKMNPGLDMIPRTFIFGAKAAAGYHRAKLIIKLINAVADVVNNDPTIHGKIKVVFMENYRVSLAEKMIPAADVSEQISTAGKEASGTGNMKFMLNGALTIGTMDGANVEICEEVGRDNIFIFGMSAAEVQQKTQEGYDPWMVYNMNQEVRMALTSLIDGTFDPDTNLFRELYDALLNGCGGRADEYFVLEDYADYARAQWDIDRAYRDEEKWVRMAILNTAESGKFSSDRTIRQYADEIWQLPSVEIV